MGGWRDAEGRTAAERKQANADAARRSFLATLRHRPASLVKPALGFVFVMVLVFALVSAMT
jgi:hypothetical protein